MLQDSAADGNAPNAGNVDDRGARLSRRARLPIVAQIRQPAGFGSVSSQEQAAGSAPMQDADEFTDWSVGTTP